MKILSGLTEGQVLQRLGSRGATILLQGTSAQDGPIRATLSQANAAVRGWKRRLVGHVVRGKFSVRLSALPVGGPYHLRLEAGQARAEVSSFFVGDVWILAGQSNMEGVGNMTGKAKPHPLIRAFSMRREWRLAQDPLHIVAESPDACHSLTQCTPKIGEVLRRDAVKGVGVGLFFAHEMLKRSGGVPQGLICAAHGGTSMQQWSPDRKRLGGQSLYASMLASVRANGQPVAGLLWYQGESDANAADAPPYTARMKKLVAATRRDLGQPRLPWMVVQIARLFADRVSPQELQAWNSIQEQERLLPGKIKFLETVPAIDLPMDDWIHIGAEGFPRLAARLASAADRLVYGNRSEIPMPRLRSARQTTDKPPFFTIEVTVDSARGGLRAPGEPCGFKLVSAEGNPLDLIYKTELRGNTAVLHLCKRLIGDVDLFYGHGRTPICNITDARGYPIPVFGPRPVGNTKSKSYLPFITQWNVSAIVPASKKIDRFSVDEIKALSTTPKTYIEDGFINEHAAWESKPGCAFFHSRFHLDEPMKLKLLMGYDGPFALWLDGKPFFKNLAGINPCFPDESGKVANLKTGAHDLHVGMDLNDGRAWGFFLRMVRLDLTPAQIRTGDFAKPTFSIKTDAKELLGRLRRFRRSMPKDFKFDRMEANERR